MAGRALDAQRARTSILAVRYCLPLFALLLACSGSRPAEVDRTGFGFGSYVRIKLLDASPARAESLVAVAFDELNRLDTLWSAFLPGSDVAVLNRERSCRVSPETAELIRSALRFAELTGGALDITVRPLSEAWGFPDADYRVPSDSELAEALRAVGYRQVVLHGDTVVLAGSARVDLGGVAVGAAVDRVVEMLESAGVTAGLVDAGGDIRVFGDRTWRIGLQDPRGDGIVRVFELSDGAVSTSGDYQKFFERDGERFHHIIDPTTGRPAGGCASVTVLAATTLAADALSTGLFVLGPERGTALLERLEGTGAVFVCEEGDSLRQVSGGELP